ncbi:hypothetical protein BCR41DRAFT_344625 [Lobosporangium transversale]|uniref:FAD-binding domain-containing protein n=1 Tax=Lobosporangium transversale TaxID=64571 RepID=A0A1Y2H0J6_9FUNG|nr:hypothetical protein BCR41DRAFT_344625 [Lobosporangium transversale]ORZ28079.1 hypothetical protein BCR41DRAFT_344625 [Lobosporangium transversale]|eukprot:XP_021885764.1 hypothetical protein BCR41DRAFT_344625 [Lobosporangium transversale]
MSNDTAAESIEEIQRTGVIIVGGGISGLFLGMLLERLELSYHIFERATEVRPLGSALTLGANIQPAFEQLGLLEQLKAISLPCPSLELYSDNLEHIGSLNLEKRKEISGYDDLIFERSKLYSLLRSQIPDSKISYGKRVTRLEEKDGQVFIHCADGFVCQGDMLAGADGAYSNVRQSLYEQLEEKGLLPKIDTEDFVIGNIVMVGVAQPLNPEKYPQLNDTKAHFSSVQGKNKQILALISAPGQRVCWSIGTGLSEAEAKEKRFKNSEWGPEANELMIKEFEDHPSPWGGTFGDFIRMTPPHLVSRVSLEEKIFQTWFHGRTVLIGDACHKMLTGAGLGICMNLKTLNIPHHKQLYKPTYSPTFFLHNAKVR